MVERVKPQGSSGTGMVRAREVAPSQGGRVSVMMRGQSGERVPRRERCGWGRRGQQCLGSAITPLPSPCRPPPRRPSLIRPPRARPCACTNNASINPSRELTMSRSVEVNLYAHAVSESGCSHSHSSHTLTPAYYKQSYQYGQGGVMQCHEAYNEDDWPIMTR